LPWFYGVLSPIGNWRIRRALGRYIWRAKPLAARLGLDTPEKRTEAFENPEVAGEEYSTYEDWFGGGRLDAYDNQPLLFISAVAAPYLAEFLGGERGYELAKSRDLAAMIACLEDLATREQDSSRRARIFWAIGEVYSHQGEHAAEIASLERAIETNPSEPDYRSDLGFRLSLGKQHSDSIDNLRRAIELGGDLPRHYFRLGHALTEASLFDEAIRAYDACITCSKTTPRNTIWIRPARESIQDIRRRRDSP
jgi:tetratricopeptide (TPR) repeat protein